LFIQQTAKKSISIYLSMSVIVIHVTTNLFWSKSDEEDDDTVNMHSALMYTAVYKGNELRCA